MAIIQTQCSASEIVNMIYEYVGYPNTQLSVDDNTDDNTYELNALGTKFVHNIDGLNAEGTLNAIKELFSFDYDAIHAACESAKLASDFYHALPMPMSTSTLSYYAGRYLADKLSSKYTFYKDVTLNAKEVATYVFESILLSNPDRYASGALETDDPWNYSDTLIPLSNKPLLNIALSQSLLRDASSLLDAINPIWSVVYMARNHLWSKAHALCAALRIECPNNFDHGFSDKVIEVERLLIAIKRQGLSLETSVTVGTLMSELFDALYLNTLRYYNRVNEFKPYTPNLEPDFGKACDSLLKFCKLYAERTEGETLTNVQTFVECGRELGLII